MKLRGGCVEKQKILFCCYCYCYSWNLRIIVCSIKFMSCCSICSPIIPKGFCTSNFSITNNCFWFAGWIFKSNMITTINIEAGVIRRIFYRDRVTLWIIFSFSISIITPWFRTNYRSKWTWSIIFKSNISKKFFKISPYLSWNHNYIIII